MSPIQQHAYELATQLLEFDSELQNRRQSNSKAVMPLSNNELHAAIDLTRNELADAELELQNLQRDLNRVYIPYRSSLSNRFRPGGSR